VVEHARKINMLRVLDSSAPNSTHERPTIMKSISAFRTTAVAAAIAAAIAYAPAATALTANADLTVTASVASNCTISTNPLAFGAYDPVVANATTALNGSGSVVIACTKGATGLSVGLANGNNYTTTRRMAGGGDFLSYGLFQPPNNTPGTACTFPAVTAWGTAVGTTLGLTSPASKTARTYNICGTVPAGQDVSVAATYTDTVVATITF
jgi:spore coat protein U-like protein